MANPPPPMWLVYLLTQRRPTPSQSVTLLFERLLTKNTQKNVLTSEEEVGPGDEGSGVNEGVLLILTALQLQQLEKGICESQTSSNWL